MPQLLKNEGISFIAAKNFTYRGTPYVMGEEFPQEEANNIETLVRARFVLPVLEEGHLRPRHWAGHIRTREEAEEYLNRDRVQLVWPTEPDSDEVVNLETLTYPERTPEPEGEGEDVLAPDEDGDPDLDPENPDEPTFDPGDHTVAEVEAYLADHPEDSDRVIAAERAGRGRKGIVGED